MAEQTFKSPGFFEREIDASQRSASRSFNVPGGIIGIASRGPAFVPKTITSMNQFSINFGEIEPDQFGAIAANEYLKLRPAITFTRVLGAGSIQNGSDLDNFTTLGVVPNAGFSLSGSDTVIDGDTRHKGCVQFITAKHTVSSNEQHSYPIFTDNDTVVDGSAYLVRSMVLLASGARLEVLDHNEVYSASGSANDLAKISNYEGNIKSQGNFKIVISSSMGSLFSNDESKVGIKIYTASLNPDSDYYVGKVLNTSYNQFHTKQHLLLADFIVENDIAKVTYDNSNATVAVVSGSGNTSSDGDSTKQFRELFGSFNTKFKNAKTTSFISQPYGSQEYDLFHFETLSDGENANKLVSVSISTLRKSEDINDPYGTFTVQVRKYSDDDNNPVVYEQYNNCNLNPDSEDYVGRRIGDLNVYYNFNTVLESERGLAQKGTYPNQSNFIRIVLHPNVTNKIIPKSALPFGFRGLPVLKTTDTLTSTANALAGLGGAGKRLGVSGSDESFIYSVVPPIPMTFKITKGIANTSTNFTGESSQNELINSNIYWGVQQGRLYKNTSFDSSVGLKNPELQSNSRLFNESSLIDAYGKFLGIQKLDALVTGSGADAFNNNKFSLSKVALNNQSNVADTLSRAITREITGSADDHMIDAAYIRNAKLDLPNLTINDNASNSRRLTFASLVTSDANTFNKFSKFAKFTNVFYGGFDGLNVLDKDSRLMNDKASSLETGGKASGGQISYENLHAGSAPGSGLRNNIVAAYLDAANVMTQEGVTNINTLIIPGIREKLITNKVSEKVKDNSKIIYLMDIPSYDKDGSRRFDDSTNLPNIVKTVDQFKGRNIDNNFVATYFPDTFITTNAVSKVVKVPASVSAFQALAYNDNVSFPWFAPAGFNRGALENVVNTAYKLNTADRDTLYEARINPIANFSNGKVVIFGQKTLQMSSSALDRVNVRRMVLEVKRIVTRIAGDFVFEQNTQILKDRFIAQVTPQLAIIQSQQGIDKFKVIMDNTNNSALDEEQNRLNGTIVLVPTRAIEFISIDFIITNSGVTF